MALSYLETRSRSGAKEGSEDNSSGECTDEQRGGNAGWANSIAKVLSTTKPKSKKTLVLSRAKKIKDAGKIEKDEPNYGFKVEGEIKEEKPVEEQEASSKQVKNKTNILRVKPSWKDIDRERMLRKIATRGVVQLFNAVRTQQKDLQHQLEEAGPLDSRKEAILNINKRNFLDVLMSGKRSKSEHLGNPVKNELSSEENESSDEDDDTKKSEWSVLRADYMTNKKINHWDEDGSQEE